MRSQRLVIIFSVIIFPFALISQTQLGETIKAPARGFFGTSVAISEDGKVLAVGAPGSDQNGENSGSISTYRFERGNWKQFGQTIIGDFPNDQAGHSLSISGDGSRLVVGALTNSEEGKYYGQVKIYSQSGNKWVQLGQTLYGETEKDFWGRVVVISADGSTVVAGSCVTQDSRDNSGKLKVYRLTDNTWQQIGDTFQGVVGSSFLGESADLSQDGNILAIGIPGSSLLRKNAAFTSVFSFDGKTWSKMGRDIIGANSGDGVSLSSDGKTLAVANFGDGRPYYPVRETRVFNFDGKDWNQIGDNILNADAPLALSSDGKTLAARTYNFDWKNSFEEGQIGRFRLEGGQWQLKGKYLNGAAPLSQLGWSIAISADGKIIASGARAANKSAGLVKVYQWK